MVQLELLIYGIAEMGAARRALDDTAGLHQAAAHYGQLGDLQTEAAPNSQAALIAQEERWDELQFLTGIGSSTLSLQTLVQLGGLADKSRLDEG